MNRWAMVFRPVGLTASVVPAVERRRAPRALARADRGADFGDLARVNRVRGVAPLATDVGEQRGDLSVGQRAQRGHLHVVLAAAHYDRAGHAVENDADEALLAAERPLRVKQRR